MASAASRCIIRLSLRTSEAIKPPHHQGVAGPGVVDRCRQFWSITLCARDLLDEDLLTACIRQRIKLQLRVLVLGRDASVAE